MGDSIQDKDVMKTGTTTLGLVLKDGVILAADRRATAGSYIMDKKTQKIYRITKNTSVTIAGTASDAQLLAKLAQSELRLKKFRTNREATVKETASLFSRMVYENIRKMSMIPGISHFILGGKNNNHDNKDFQLFDIFPDGTISEISDFVSSGSGSVMVYGVLETLYNEEMSIEDGVKLALKAMNAALRRDSASGDGIDIITITKDGTKKVFEKEFNSVS